MKPLTPKILIEIVAAIVAIVTGLIFLADYFRDKEICELHGAWKFTFAIKESSMRTYVGMTAGYKIYITQEGKKIKGKGEKFWINEREIPSSQHDPLIFEGLIKDDSLKVHYELLGDKRSSFGEFAVKINNVPSCMLGSFCGSAANTKGEVIAVRE